MMHQENLSCNTILLEVFVICCKKFQGVVDLG